MGLNFASLAAIAFRLVLVATPIFAGYAEQKERLRGLGKGIEAIYWRGIATYLTTHSNEEMYRVWQEIRDRFPDSVWAKRVP